MQKNNYLGKYIQLIKHIYIIFALVFVYIVYPIGHIYALDPSDDDTPDVCMTCTSSAPSFVSYKTFVTDMINDGLEVDISFGLANNIYKQNTNILLRANQESEFLAIIKSYTDQSMTLGLETNLEKNNKLWKNKQSEILQIQDIQSKLQRKAGEIVAKGLFTKSSKSIDINGVPISATDKTILQNDSDDMANIIEKNSSSDPNADGAIFLYTDIQGIRVRDYIYRLSYTDVIIWLSHMNTRMSNFLVDYDTNELNKALSIQDSIYGLIRFHPKYIAKLKQEYKCAKYINCSVHISIVRDISKKTNLNNSISQDLNNSKLALQNSLKNLQKVLKDDRSSAIDLSEHMNINHADIDLNKKNNFGDILGNIGSSISSDAVDILQYSKKLGSYINNMKDERLGNKTAISNIQTIDVSDRQAQGQNNQMSENILGSQRSTYIYILSDIHNLQNKYIQYNIANQADIVSQFFPYISINISKNSNQWHYVYNVLANICENQSKNHNSKCRSSK